jgi:hypothetical protein
MERSWSRLEWVLFDENGECRIAAATRFVSQPRMMRPAYDGAPENAASESNGIGGSIAVDGVLQKTQQARGAKKITATAKLRPWRAMATRTKSSLGAHRFLSTHTIIHSYG